MVNIVLRILCWIFLTTPFIALGVWGAGLLIKSSRNEESSYVGGACVILVGIAFISYIYGFLTIIWNNYRFKINNLV